MRKSVWKKRQKIVSTSKAITSNKWRFLFQVLEWQFLNWSPQYVKNFIFLSFELTEKYHSSSRIFSIWSYLETFFSTSHIEKKNHEKLRCLKVPYDCGKKFSTANSLHVARNNWQKGVLFFNFIFQVVSCRWLAPNIAISRLKALWMLCPRCKILALKPRCNVVRIFACGFLM